MNVQIGYVTEQQKETLQGQQDYSRTEGKR